MPYALLQQSMYILYALLLKYLQVSGCVSAILIVSSDYVSVDISGCISLGLIITILCNNYVVSANMFLFVIC